jgi:hypothetical protein
MRRSFKGTKPQHRKTAAASRAMLSARLGVTRNALQRGNCTVALASLLGAQGAYASYMANRSWSHNPRHRMRTTKRAAGVYSSLLRTQRDFARKCLRASR